MKIRMDEDDQDGRRRLGWTETRTDGWMGGWMDEDLDGQSDGENQDG